MATPEDRLTACFDTSEPRESFNDEQIETIALLLARCSHATERLAGRSPRTYIICRMIGRCDLLPRLLCEGFGDDWFPVSKAGLPGYLDPRIKTRIFETQHIILTKSLNLENGRHCHFGTAGEHPFEIQSRIGSGSFGQVHVVESRVTHKQYALKTVRRSKAFGTKSREIMSIFKTEMKIMKGLRHRHIVRYIGSYTDRNDLGLLISPVADCDLEEYLEKACKTPDRHPTLRTFFGCLATALSYLHDEGIKHRDIKPKNILVHKANVLLADFGISHDFLDTTTGPTIATQKYCSPEVANYEGRNASADVWSLGCVFLEIQSALQGKDSDWIKSYYEAHGNGSTRYHSNTDGTLDLLRELRSTTEDGMHARPLTWIEHMLTVNRRARPTAAETMNRITSADSPVGFLYSCDQCSYPSSEPESVEYTEDGTANAHQYAQGSNDQLVKSEAAPSLQVLFDPSPGIKSERQMLVIAGRSQSPKKIVPSDPTATRMVAAGAALEGEGASTNTSPRRKVDTTNKENERRREQELDRRWVLKKDFDRIAATRQNRSSPRASPSSMALPQRMHVTRTMDRHSDKDLYLGLHTFSKGPHLFFDCMAEWEAWIPRIVVYCTQTVLGERRKSSIEQFLIRQLMRRKISPLSPTITTNPTKCRISASHF